MLTDHHCRFGTCISLPFDRSTTRLMAFPIETLVFRAAVPATKVVPIIIIL